MQQTALFSTTTWHPVISTDSEVRYCPAFLKATVAADLYRHLVKALCWKQDSIRIFGQQRKIPRLQAWYGDAGAHYSYSGLPMEAMPWEPRLAQLRHELERALAADFNGVLANYYRHGQDSMGWHSDDEPELGPLPTIAMLSLGQPRRFVLRHKATAQKHSLTLASGSLLVMSGATQSDWQHALPKSQQPMEGRISLTFRQIWPVAGGVK